MWRQRLVERTTEMFADNVGLPPEAWMTSPSKEGHTTSTTTLPLGTCKTPYIAPLEP